MHQYNIAHTMRNLSLFSFVALAFSRPSCPQFSINNNYNIALLNPTSSILGMTPPTINEPSISTKAISTVRSVSTNSPTPTFIPGVTTVEDLWDQTEIYSPVLVAVKSNLTNNTDFYLPPDPPKFLPSYLSETTKELKFPKGFKYGVSTVATQVEGATKEDGKGPIYLGLWPARISTSL
jgi:hypothetical protein